MSYKNFIPYNFEKPAHTVKAIEGRDPPPPPPPPGAPPAVG